MALTLAKRLCARSIALPVSSRCTAVFFEILDFDRAKRRAADWEPALDVTDLLSRWLDAEPDADADTHEADNDNDPGLVHVRTYSAFDPGATHALQLSAPPLPLPSPAQMRTRRPSIAATDRTPEVRQDVSSPDSFRPWSYSLPRALRSKAGTTFGCVYGGGGSGRTEGGEGEELGVLQRVFRGVSEAGLRSGEGRRRG